MRPHFPILRRLDPPAVATVTLAEAKAWLRYDDDDQDALIQGLIDAAVSHLDGWGGVLGRCLIDQRWAYLLPGGLSFARFALPFPDCKSILVEAAESGGALAPVDGLTLAPEPDACGGVWGIEVIGDFPTLPYARPILRVSFVAGFGPAAADVPAALREAILTRVANRFRNRETAVADDIAALISPWRMASPL